MSETQAPLLLLTDLDGSLLDHHDYSPGPARSWLTRLRARGAWVVPNTSKTAAELTPLMRSLGLAGQPWIAENGGVVALPASWLSAYPLEEASAPDAHGLCRIAVAMPRRAILEVLEGLREEFAFEGFAAMSVARISELTGLGEADAALAGERDASEPLVWQDAPERLEEFRTRLASHGLKLTRGGRFHHVTGDTDKGVAARYLIARYRLCERVRPWTLGFGDGANDLPLLAAVDNAVLIPGVGDTSQRDRELAEYPLLADERRCFRANHPGPQGWVEGLRHWLANGQSEEWTSRGLRA